MKYIFFLIVSFAMLQAVEHPGFTINRDTAQYKGSDYANVVGVARNISLETAFDMAASNADVDYFVYTKGDQMVLEIPSDVPFDPSEDHFGLVSNVNFIYDSGRPGEGYCRIFRHGDAVFFKKEGVWLGSAPGLADTYFKDSSMLK